MENPAGWNKAERVIDEALRQHHEGMQAGIVGPSIVKTIANALRDAGYKIEDEDSAH